VVNAPQNNKYCYWTSDDTPGLPDDWMEGAKEQAGSWWTHWNEWMVAHNDAGKTAARQIKKSLEPAPGRYVRMSAD
jgi:polyhydroxyalkanoate synthase